MNEWGIPDWRDAESYGDTDDWNLRRWFWEFLRRRDDLRREFDEKKDAEFERARSLAAKIPAAAPDGVRSPDQPGFYVATYLIHPCEPDFAEKLPNPRISVHPHWAMPSLLDRSLVTLNKRWVEFGERHHRIDFDLDRPLKPQIEAAERLLKEAQEHRHGKALQKRRHPKKWLMYLRILDGRAAGASWSQLSAILPHRSGEPQAARDAWGQARGLCYNF